MKHLFLFISLACAIALTGCDQLEYKGEPQYILYIQDGPADYKSLSMSISSVELFDGANWNQLPTNKAPFDLLKLTGGNMLKIATANMPAAKYTALKITFNPDNITLNQNRVNHQVTIPTQCQILEIPINIQLEKNHQHTDILDIDAAASIIESDTQEFQFIPKAKLFDITKMGVLNFMIVNSKNQPIAQTIHTKAYIPGATDTTYTYTNISTARGLMRLPEGVYDLVIVPDQSAKLLPDTLRNVKIMANQPTSLPAIQLSSSVLQ